MSLSRLYREMIDGHARGVLPSLVMAFCLPLAAIFRLAVAVRRALYRSGALRSYRAAVPVVSVGNLTVGGTGKTPVVDFLLKALAGRGVRATVVSRGYGGRFRGEVGVVAQGDGLVRMTAKEAGDEPCLLARRNPGAGVLIARTRASGVRAAECSGAQIVILDDGFQHLAVQRDLDIVLLDARRPFGNCRLLPAGPLREPVTALQRAGLFILTHADAAPDQSMTLPAPVLRCRHRLADILMDLDGGEWPWSTLDGREVVAFAGIASPADFFAALRAKGVTLAGTIALRDHQDYSDRLLSLLRQSCNNNQLLLTTEKDAVKLRAADLPGTCLVVPLRLEFDDEAPLLAALDGLLDGMDR